MPSRKGLACVALPPRTTAMAPETRASRRAATGGGCRHEFYVASRMQAEDLCAAGVDWLAWPQNLLGSDKQQRLCA